ncbi:ATP-binding cassette domain-containing protein [Aquabacterium humicola]|uniref:ATP-binding cassette domain-containing protein n=1 Tax=Aquabacterium humicola TaxID=3237377 RepID=UPI0025429C1F|nr:ATP-binding cassette domain-containing protein [Rubrivivax pictus]
MSSFSTGRIAPAAPAAASPPSPSIHLHDLQWHLPDGRPLWQAPLQLSIGRERLGLVGRNGVGKSVLAQIVAGRAPAVGTVTGSVLRSGRVHLVAPPLLPQDRRSVGDAMGLGPVFDAVARLAAGTATPDDLVLADGQWDVAARVAQALTEAGLPDLQPGDAMAGLSGGERMRVVLAGAMTTDAQVIVLDEPSNHLDAEARGWLMHWLQHTERGVVIVSHDRSLLRVVDRIAELSPRGLTLYGGNYALYRAQRDGDESAAQAALQHARAQRETTLARLRRDQEARQRRQARGRRLARTANLPAMVINGLRETAEATAARDAQRDADKRQSVHDAVRAAAERAAQPPAIFLALPASRVPADKPVLDLQGLRLPHVGGPIADITLAGPIRVAVTGPNGCGKSTLLRVIAGALAPLQGSATTQVRTAALDQDGGDLLPPDRSLLDGLRALDCPLPASELRTRLAQLRLDAARVLLPMGQLSAGERLKAALACALWRKEPARLLLLDEPTNHLDLDTTLVLQRALQGFEGALIVASHDEEFLDALRPTHRWEWRDGRLVMRQSSMARVARAPGPDRLHRAAAGW